MLVSFVNKLKWESSMLRHGTKQNVQPMLLLVHWNVAAMKRNAKTWTIAKNVLSAHMFNVLNFSNLFSARICINVACVKIFSPLSVCVCQIFRAISTKLKATAKVAYIYSKMLFMRALLILFWIFAANSSPWAHDAAAASVAITVIIIVAAAVVGAVPSIFTPYFIHGLLVYNHIGMLFQSILY